MMGQLERNEQKAERIKAIEYYDLLSEEVAQDFQNIVELAASICEVPSSLISIVGEERQWFKASVGVPSSGSTRDISFCSHTILQDGLFLIKDAREDVRFNTNPFVTEPPGVVFYAGFPIKVENHNLGALCVLDNKPRELSENQINSLNLLAKQATKLIELRGREQDLRKQNKLVTQRNEELSNSNHTNQQLMSMISHDVRGPIGSILTFFKSEKDAAKNWELMQKVLPMIETSLSSIYDMVDNMLSWSSHINNPRYERINLYKVVEETHKLCHSQLVVKDDQLENKVDKSIDISCDRGMLMFILRNLIGNAIKYTEKGTITVKAEKRDNDVEISITDTGIGISELLMEKIINPDKKVSTPGTKKEKGSGMGINFVHQCLKKMNAKLQITSVEKEGSTFSFSLPKAD